MQYSITSIYIEGMICAVEQKCSFCALESFKIGYFGVFSKIFHFSENSVLSTYLDIFSQVEQSQVCGKQHPLNPPLFLVLNIALTAI